MTFQHHHHFSLLFSQTTHHDTPPSLLANAKSSQKNYALPKHTHTHQTQQINQSTVYCSHELSSSNYYSTKLSFYNRTYEKTDSILPLTEYPFL